MLIKSSVICPKENKQERSIKDQVPKMLSRCDVAVGDPTECPECKTMARVVWVSQDKKTMGIQCHAKHKEADTLQSKFGPTKTHSTKTRRDVIFLTAIEG